MLGADRTIGGYHVDARLQSGGMGTLYLAHRKGPAGFTKKVAIKLIHPHLSRDPAFRQMFVNEALLSARIDHANVVRVQELGEWNDSYFLAMEYVDGCSLMQLMSALRKMGRRVSAEVAVAIAVQVADGLHAAHETRDDEGSLLGLVHRDVSPSNILVSFGGDVKLIDFGIAKATHQSGESKSLRGKLRYMSPEQASGSEIDRRSDVYALGIVLWEMLTGTRLFKTSSDMALLDQVRHPKVKAPAELVSGISAGLDRGVMRALAPAAADRPATAREFRDELAQVLPNAWTRGATQLTQLLEALPRSLLGGPSPVGTGKPTQEEKVVSTEVGDTLSQLSVSLSDLADSGVADLDLGDSRVADLDVADLDVVDRPSHAHAPGASHVRRRWVAVGAIAIVAALAYLVMHLVSPDEPPLTAAEPHVSDQATEQVQTDPGSSGIIERDLDITASVDAGSLRVNEPPAMPAKTRARRGRRSKMSMQTGTTQSAPLIETPTF